jgi:lipoate-protein ligase A
MSKQTVLRVICEIDEPRSGAWNMAVDEAILQGVNAGESPATLRFYKWAEPTISLGYFQKYEEFQGQDEVIRRMPMVRRQTGGGAILHDDELTYSLVVPLDGRGVTEIEGLYRLVHDAFVAVLAREQVRVEYRGGEDKVNSQRGPFFCFSRKHWLDLVVGEDKLLGSAQRRIKNAVLQHGSLILERHFEQQESAQLVRQVNDRFELAKLIEGTAEQVADKLKSMMVRERLNEFERGLFSGLEAKYAGQEWNCQR